MVANLKTLCAFQCQAAIGVPAHRVFWEVEAPRFSLQAPARFAAAAQTRIETQLILKGNPEVIPRSQLEFVVTAPPEPKQQFADHTGQTSISTRQPQSSPNGLFDQKTHTLGAKQ